MVMTRNPGMMKISTFAVAAKLTSFDIRRSEIRNSFWRKSTSSNTAMLRKKGGAISRNM